MLSESDGHLDYYFLLLTGLMVMNQVYFNYICKGYEYKNSNDFAKFNDLIIDSPTSRESLVELRKSEG